MYTDSHSRSETEVTKEVEYWKQVMRLPFGQRSRSGYNLQDCIATKLSWPRTYLFLHNRDITSLTNDSEWALTNLACPLSAYHGCVKLSDLEGWDRNVFCHLTKLQSLNLARCNQSTITD